MSRRGEGVAALASAGLVPSMKQRLRRRINLGWKLPLQMSMWGFLFWWGTCCFWGVLKGNQEENLKANDSVRPTIQMAPPQINLLAALRLAQARRTRRIHSSQCLGQHEDCVSWELYT